MLLLFRDGVLWRFSIPLSNTHTLKTHETHNNTQNKSEKKGKKGLKQEGKKTPQKTISANFSAEAFQIMSYDWETNWPRIPKSRLKKETDLQDPSKPPN